MRSRLLFFAILGIILLGIIAGAIYLRGQSPSATDPAAVAPTAVPSGTVSPGVDPSATPSIIASPGPGAKTTSNPNPDLTVDAGGLSKATVVITTPHGVIKFKFYPGDAPATVKRIIELINQGFYNGLTFHRVVPGFVIQGGDPQGNGTGGTGQHLKAEFNERRHIEGAVAMARAPDPDSADSQFYIALATLPNLDRSYTVFGQVIEGMDVVRKIQVGDKMTSVIIE